MENGDILHFVEKQNVPILFPFCFYLVSRSNHSIQAPPQGSNNRCDRFDVFTQGSEIDDTGTEQVFAVYNRV